MSTSSVSRPDVPVKLTKAQRIVLTRAAALGGLVNDWRNANWCYRTSSYHRIVWRQHRMIERLIKAGMLVREDPEQVHYRQIYFVTPAGIAALAGSDGAK